MTHFENVVVGKPIVEPKSIFAFDEKDWDYVEKEKTFFTEERRLPQILKDIGVVPSIAEVRRNKPQLNIVLDKLDFITVKWGKRKIFILVGE